MTEQEMRDSEVPRIKTSEELTAYINALVSQQHDYGTCVYAMSMSAVAAFNYVAHALGVTGFQASCADMDILKRTRSMDSGFRIINYADLLYPQYLTEEHFPSAEQLIEECAETLSKQAKENLAKSPTAHPSVIAHWERLAKLQPKTAPQNNAEGAGEQQTTAV